MPTRKWFAQQITAAGGWVVALINASWDLTPALQITGVGIVVAAVVSYLIPNDGGVPNARSARRKSR